MAQKNRLNDIELESLIDFVRENPTIDKKECHTKWVEYYTNIPDKEFLEACEKVKIFEHADSNNVKIAIFKYDGVFGGWENDILTNVVDKYTGDVSGFFYHTADHDTQYRIFMEGLDNEEIYSDYEDNKNIQHYKMSLGKNAELNIIYDNETDSDSRNIAYWALCDKFSRTNYKFTDGNIYGAVFLKYNTLDFQPSAEMIKNRIRKRKIENILEDEEV